ncbi:MAG: ArdC family protein [Thermodesulfobacteriota bacterium]
MAMINFKEYHKKLVEEVKQVIESESFRELIEFSTKFRSYSFGNTLMIWTERKDATHVAGMKAWNSLGRKVKKGERGIAIFAPIFKRRKTPKLERKRALKLKDQDQ